MFYQRASGKISPIKFLDIVFHSVSQSGYLSLNQSAIEFGEQQICTISKQAIDKRFNGAAAKFLQLLIEQALATQISQLLCDDFLRNFPSLRIKDGTRFDLPPQLHEYYKGFGGKCTSDAALCIQYEFDLKTLKFIHFKLTSANVPDRKETSLEQNGIAAGNLHIQDLGYFNLASFQKMNKVGAYFISRLSPAVLVYENDTEVCFEKLYKEMTRSQTIMLEKNITLGAKKELTARLVIQLVSEDCYKSRIATLEKEAKRRGRAISDALRLRARFSLMITNIPTDKIPAAKLYYLYRLRWQIELMFKHWKSKLGIDKVQKMRFERLQCLLYGKLLYIMLTIEVISVARHELYRRYSKILSIDKCLKTFLYDSLILQFARLSQSSKLYKKVAALFKTVSQNHWQEKRKNRVNFEDIFELFTCNTDK